MLSYTYKDVQFKEAETVMYLMRKNVHIVLEVAVCKTQINMPEEYWHWYRRRRLPRCGMGKSEPEQGSTAAFSEYGNEPVDSIKYGLTLRLAIQLLACP